MNRFAVVATAALAACQPPGSGAPATRPAPPPHSFTLIDLVGGWRWLHRTTEDGTTRIEDETWRFAPMPGAPAKLVGRYVRTVEVRSDDGMIFQCNQRPWYRQRAVFDVEVDLTATGFAVREVGYRTEPSPCDHDFRKTVTYRAELDGARLRLAWPATEASGPAPGAGRGGSQTLWRIDDAPAELPADPWPATPKLVGTWRWEMTSFDDEGNVHDESEWWQITRRSETQLDLTYRRRVVVRTPDGSPIACAGAPSWSFDDAYLLDGRREEEHWHFYERAAEPGDHPCLRVTPRRALDEATAEQHGDHLVLEWRGKRRQVLYRAGRAE